MKSACFAPTDTVTCDGFGVQPRDSAVRAQMACFSDGMPVTAVYFDTPGFPVATSIAARAASKTNAEGSKSGSPTPNAYTSTPLLRISAARAFMARVTLGWTASRRRARELGMARSLARLTQRGEPLSRPSRLPCHPPCHSIG